MQLQIQERTKGFSRRPDIYRRRAPELGDIAVELNVTIPDWTELRRRRELEMLQQYGLGREGPRPVIKSVAMVKGRGSGRTYTSKYRGVHQTFPTRRWEAQFRRNGKPTSLGCFDYEDEAAKAYDKMMIWCEIHNVSNMKGAMTNFEASDYEGDVPWLQQVTQDELVQILRSDGRRQASKRTVRQRRPEPNHAVGPAAGMAAAKEREALAVAAKAAGLTTVFGLPPSYIRSPGVMPTSAGPSTGVSSEHTQGS